MLGVLRVGQFAWTSMRSYVLASSDERMAYLLARASTWCAPDGQRVLDLLVTRALLVPDCALTMQSRVRVEIDPTFTREVLIACYETGLSLVDVHTHPFSDRQVCFSGHDVANMRVTHADFLGQMPAQPPVGAASLVLGQASVAGAFTDMETGELRPLRRISILGDAAMEVAL